MSMPGSPRFSRTSRRSNSRRCVVPVVPAVVDLEAPVSVAPAVLPETNEEGIRQNVTFSEGRAGNPTIDLFPDHALQGRSGSNFHCVATPPLSPPATKRLGCGGPKGQASG